MTTYDQPPTHGTRNTLYVLIAIVVLAVAVGAGTLISHAIWPAQRGRTGAIGLTGKTGTTGATGIAGPAGTASNFDPSKYGFCVEVDQSTSGTLSYVSGVEIYPPESSDGTQSCPTGEFETIAPSTDGA